MFAGIQRGFRGQRLMRRKVGVLAATAAITVGVGSVRGQVVELPRDFSTTQGQYGIRYVSVGDTRPGNTLNPGPGEITELSFLGFVDQITQAGDLYAGVGGYPQALHDTARDMLHLHPGTGGHSLGSGSANLGVAVEWTVDTYGTYRVLGDFARANINRAAGNGVELWIYLNDNLSAPLFASVIDADHDVNLDDAFGGTGVVGFDFTVSLQGSDRLLFAIFADGQGQDGTFDGSAFRFAATAVPELSDTAWIVGGSLALWGVLRRRGSSFV